MSYTVSEILTLEPILGMYESGGAFPVPGPGAWPSGPTTNLSATYMAWGQDWATYAGAFINECNANSLIPFVELEPWDATNPTTGVWDVTPLFSDITGGTWDTWLEEIGTFIAGTGKPCILTFAHEMNVSGQYPWSQGDTGSGPGGGTLTAAEWQVGWKYVHDKVNSTAGGLAIWMWACSAWTGGTTVNPTPWWPGDSYVDMVGIDGYPTTEYGPTLGSFAGQLQQTVTAIRALGWTNPIYISETNLAEMVASSGGQDIPDFVAAMHAAGVSGIMEFEESYEPDMTGAQWTQYNTAVAANYGTGGGTGGNTVTVTSPGSQAGTAGTAISTLAVSATDSGSGQTLTWTATGLPAGLSISSSTGHITGTPAAAGTYSVTVKATDTTAAFGSASFTWVISSSGGGGGGTFTSVGSWTETTGTTFPWQPAAIGNTLAVVALSTVAGAPVTGVESSNATWEQVVEDQTLGSTTVTEATAFLGVATSTGEQAVALTTTAGSGNLRVLAREFSTSGAPVLLDTFAVMSGDASGQVTAWPSVTPAQGGSECLIGYERNFNDGAVTAVAGSTSGVSYYVDPLANGGAYDTDVSAATAVGWGDTDSRTVLVLLLYAAASGGGSPAPSSGMLMAGIV
jgi:hypothetical protein